MAKTDRVGPKKKWESKMIAEINRLRSENAALKAELETAKAKTQELLAVIEELRVQVRYPHDLDDRD